MSELRHLVIALLLAMLACAASATGSVLLADFQTSDPAAVHHNADQKVSSRQARATTNSLDGSRALEFSAVVVGKDAGRAGCSIPVTTGALSAQLDTVEFDARAHGESRSLFLTLTEADRARWNCNVKLTPQWRRYSVPLNKFTFFTGPSARKKTFADLSKVVSVDPWIDNMFQGGNGFALDNLRLRDAAEPIVLRLVSSPKITLQRPATLVFEAAETTAGARSNFTGLLAVDVPDRNTIGFPSQVEIRQGRAEFEVFARKKGTQLLYLFEPANRYELCVPLEVQSEGLEIDFSFSRFDGQQVIDPNKIVIPKLRLEGESSVPLSVHLEMKDHTGRRVLSQCMSVSEISAQQAKVQIPLIAQLSVVVRAVAEPVSQLPHSSLELPLRYMTSTGETTSSEASLFPADGVTTDVIMGHLVALEDLPSTATVLGEDRFALWSMIRPVVEQRLYKSPFGLCSGDLFRLPTEQIATTGNRRLAWHHRLGSEWGRDELLWHAMQTSTTITNWGRADTVVNTYKANQIRRLLGTLGYASAWSAGKAPADDQERKHWRNWVSSLVQRYGNRIPVYEVWNEPNRDLWTPQPSIEDYRKLVQATHEATRAGVQPLVAAGAVAGFDPVFLDELMGGDMGNYYNILSLHLYPLRPDESPEDNDLSLQIEATRDIMRRHQAISKELWLSEIGWPSTPATLSEELQANYLTRAYVIALSHRVLKVFWSDLCDTDRLAWNSGNDSHLGLLDSNYRPKPAAMAYNQLQYMMVETRPRGERRIGRAYVHSFNIIQHSAKWPGVMHVAWTNSPGEKEEIELPLEGGGPLFAIDYLGAERRPSRAPDMKTSSCDQPTTPTCRFVIDHEPLYIWDSGAPPKRRTSSH